MSLSMRKSLWMVIGLAVAFLAFCVFLLMTASSGPKSPYTLPSDPSTKRSDAMKAYGDATVKMLTNQWDSAALETIFRKEFRKGTLYDKLLVDLPVFKKNVGRVKTFTQSIQQESQGTPQGLGALYRYTADVTGEDGDCVIIVAIATDIKGAYILAIELRATSVVRG